MPGRVKYPRCSLCCFLFLLLTLIAPYRYGLIVSNAIYLPNSIFLDVTSSTDPPISFDDNNSVRPTPSAYEFESGGEATHEKGKIPFLTPTLHNN
uniref:Uncharacterized protein n=1 Tax=Lactuca sativa TaxID=4236 RepID=A0A9R1XJZ5_LACSA|nr:hypothetical protein LSAT_V11C400158360 [Lactuca sativa]